MTLDSFQGVLAKNQWMRIDEMVEALDAAGYWDEDQLAAAQDHFKKQHVRQMAKRVMSADGKHRAFASVVMQDELGNAIRVYKQETLFDLNDYRQVVNYHKNLGLHHLYEANAYAKRGSDRFGTQIPLPFPTFDEAA